MKYEMRFAETTTVVAGLVGMGFAIFLSRFDIPSIVDVSLELGGHLGGGFAGSYTLGMFSRRANWLGVAFGCAVSSVVTFVAWTIGLVHSWFYLPLSIFVCVAAGYAASWFFPPPNSTKGLTIFADDRVA
jgi:Na+/proline symporter